MTSCCKCCTELYYDLRKIKVHSCEIDISIEIKYAITPMDLHFINNAGITEPRLCRQCTIEFLKHLLRDCECLSIRQIKDMKYVILSEYLGGHNKEIIGLAKFSDHDNTVDILEAAIEEIRDLPFKKD